MPTKQNSGDIVSRGCNVDELNSTIWFNGPQFLLQEPSSWTVNMHFELSPKDEALKKPKTNMALIVVEKTRLNLLKYIEEETSYIDLATTVAYSEIKQKFSKNRQRQEK